MHEDTQNDTVMGQLRGKRQRLAAEQTVDLPVAGYGGELVVRYRLLDPLTEGKAIGDRVLAQFKEQDERVYHALVDSLIAGCIAIFAKVGTELVPLAGEATVTTFEDTTALAELLAFDEPAGARKTVEEVFGGNRNAVIAHGLKLQNWMADPAGELDARTLR